MKRFEYYPLVKELKAQTDIAKNYSKSSLIYDANHSFYKYYCDSKKFNNLSFKSKYSFLAEFFKDLNKFNNLKTHTKKEASELYNELLKSYFDEYTELSDAKRKNIKFKYISNKLFFKAYNYDPWFENEELTDKEESVDLSDMLPLEGDAEEVKEGKELRILTLTKLLTGLSILLEPIKVENNSYKLKNEIKYYIYFINTNH